MDQTPDLDLQIFLLAHTAQQRAVKKRRRKLLANRPQARVANIKRSKKQSIGDAFEDLACRHLEDAGLTVLARQLCCPRGEIDLVLREQDTLVFVEVRARTHTCYGGAAASITSHKQNRLVRAAKWHLSSLTQRFFAAGEPSCRIDVIAFEQGHIQWLRDAIRLEQDK